MKYRIFLIIILFAFFACEPDEYEVDFDESQIQCSIVSNNLIIKNNSPYPVVFDEIIKNDKSIVSFIKYRNCSYVKYRDEIFLNIKDSDNQYILLGSILLPHKRKSIPVTARKGDEFEILIYPVNYNFVADNIYFKSEESSEMESRYKLFSRDEIKNLRIPFIKDEERDKINEIQGIMIYVSEYEDLTDFLEEIEFEYE